MTTPWAEFVQAHGEIIGYDLGGAFMPIKPGDNRAIRIYDEVSARFPHYAAVPVYGPKAGASVEES
jgi:hypothetical protein